MPREQPQRPQVAPGRAASAVAETAQHQDVGGLDRDLADLGDDQRDRQPQRRLDSAVQRSGALPSPCPYPDARSAHYGRAGRLGGDCRKKPARNWTAPGELRPRRAYLWRRRPGAAARQCGGDDAGARPTGLWRSGASWSWKRSGRPAAGPPVRREGRARQKSSTWWQTAGARLPRQ